MTGCASSSKSDSDCAKQKTQFVNFYQKNIDKASEVVMKTLGDQMEAALTAQIQESEAGRLRVAVMTELLNAAKLNPNCAQYAVDNLWHQASGLELPMPKAAPDSPSNPQGE